MQLSKLPDSWLFQQHSRQVLKRWLGQLSYFYFVRAWGGHANDGDAFKVGFAYLNEHDLIHKLGQLGIILSAIPDDFPRPVVGKPYAAAEFNKFKFEIRRFKNLEQPGHVFLFGHAAFVTVTDNTFEISIAGTEDNNRYEVTEKDFIVCLALESQFNNLGWRNTVDIRIEENICCISKINYPELYQK